MSIEQLSETDYFNKVYGGWLGKNIGGTLGVPVEGRKELLDLTFYPVLPDEPLENDDLDMQLVWLHALEQYGARLTAKELGQEWVEHIFFPFDEYGYALANLRRGLLPPVSGSFNNPFKDCMGSPIRSEIWAMVAPGRPDVAVYYAYQDAIVDHAGGEGVYGEMFFAAIESAAFVETDRSKLIAIGLSYIPAGCRTAQAVNDLLRWHQEGKDWIEARNLILKHHGRDNFTDAPQNIAFTVLGWLYGESFGDAILKAVNCGYDTDCTGATLGAILGIIGGSASLPKEWVKPVGDRIVVSPPVKGFPAPKNLDELTRRTIRVGKEVAAVWADESPSLADYHIPPTAIRYLLPQASSKPLGISLQADFGEEGPAIGANSEKKIRFMLTNLSREAWDGSLELEVPAGWEKVPLQAFEAAAGGTYVWEANVKSGPSFSPVNHLQVVIHRHHDRTIWNAERIPLPLVGAAAWRISGPNEERFTEVAFSGNHIHFTGLATDEPGVYQAETTLLNPSDRDAKIIFATVAPVSVRLDGKTVMEDGEIAECPPAFHRGPSERCIVVHLPAGQHSLHVSLRKAGDPLELYVVAVAPEGTAKPGNYYYYTDILFQ